MSYLDYEFYKYIGLKLKDARTKHKYSLEEVGKESAKQRKLYKDMKLAKFGLT